jgi:hypothetical protein
MNPAHPQTAAPGPPAAPGLSHGPVPVADLVQALQAEWVRVPHNQRQPDDWARLNQLMDQVERALAHEPAP